MLLLRPNQLINLIEHSFFSNIDFRRLGTVLDCFAHNAVLSVDGRTHRDRDGEIKRLLTDYLGAYPLIRHSNFTHDIVESEQRVTSRFTLTLQDRDKTSSERDGTAQFQLFGGKFSEVVVRGDGAISAI